MKTSFYIFLIISLFFIGAVNATAQTLTEYELLAPLPLGENGQMVTQTNANTFIPGLFRFAIMISTGLAVVMIIWGGIQYMSTDAWGGKNDAKNTIWNAVMGLLLTLSAWIIINTINPGVMNFNLSIDRIEYSPNTNAVGAPEGTGQHVSGACNDCVTLRVPVKVNACAGSVCTVNSDLGAKLTSLNRQFPLVVTEAYPPTVQHQNACHNSGTCVDVQRVTDNRIYEFVDKANQVGLKAVYEVTSESRKNTLITASCGTNAACRTALGERIAVLPGQITAEHFSVYNQ
jgi:hypothetical protein